MVAIKKEKEKEKIKIIKHFTREEDEGRIVIFSDGIGFFEGDITMWPYFYAVEDGISNEEINQKEKAHLELLQEHYKDHVFVDVTVKTYPSTDAFTIIMRPVGVPNQVLAFDTTDEEFALLPEVTRNSIAILQEDGGESIITCLPSSLFTKLYNKRKGEETNE